MAEAVEIPYKHFYSGAHVEIGVSNSYLAGTALKGIEVVDTKKVGLEVIVEYIRKKGTVRPVSDGRRVILN